MVTSKTSDYLKQLVAEQEEKLIDNERSICLLCKRIFRCKDHLMRHQSLSSLHSKRLNIISRHLSSSEQLKQIDRNESGFQYRDRARERRLKYGQPDRMIALEPIIPQDLSMTKTSLQPSNPHAQSKSFASDNKGFALLSKMGWSQGKGLGKNNEGMTDTIKIESHVGISGLGSKSHKPEANLSYKDAVKKVMYQRYYEIQDQEQQEEDDNIEDFT